MKTLSLTVSHILVAGSGDKAEITTRKDRWMLESFLFPALGARPITDIAPLELRDALRTVDESGKRETASRTKIVAGQVFRWAVLEGKTHSDITAPLRGLFATPKPNHHAAVTLSPSRSLRRNPPGRTPQPTPHLSLSAPRTVTGTYCLERYA